MTNPHPTDFVRESDADFGWLRYVHSIKFQRDKTEAENKLLLLSLLSSVVVNFYHR